MANTYCYQFHETRLGPWTPSGGVVVSNRLPKLSYHESPEQGGVPWAARRRKSKPLFSLLTAKIKHTPQSGSAAYLSVSLIFPNLSRNLSSAALRVHYLWLLYRPSDDDEGAPLFSVTTRRPPPPTSHSDSLSLNPPHSCLSFALFGPS